MKSAPGPAALPPQAKAEPAVDIAPTGWLRWQYDEWTYEHNTIYKVQNAPTHAVVRIALYAGPVAKAEPAGVSDEAEFELHCDGDYAASAFGPRASAWAEIQRYAAQYRQDGPVVIYEVARTELDAEGRAILSAAPSTGVREAESGGETVERDGCDPSLLGKKIGYHADGEPFGYLTEQERDEALTARGVGAVDSGSNKNVTGA